MIEKLIGTWLPDFQRWAKNSEDESEWLSSARPLALGELEVELTETDLHLRNYGRKTQHFTYEVSETLNNKVVLAVTLQPSGRQGTYEATLESDDTMILCLTEPKDDFMALKRA